VCEILFVLADVFQDLIIRLEIEDQCGPPGFGIRLGVIDDELEVDVSKIAAMEALSNV